MHHGCGSASPSPVFSNSGRVFAGGEGQTLADRIKARDDRRDRGQHGAGSGGNAAMLADEVDEPLIRRNRARSDDDRGQVAVQHRGAIDPRRRLERVQPRVQLIEVHRPPCRAGSPGPLRRHAAAAIGAERAAFQFHGSNSRRAFTLVPPETMRSSTSAR